MKSGSPVGWTPIAIPADVARASKLRDLVPHLPIPQHAPRMECPRALLGNRTMGVDGGNSARSPCIGL